MIFKEERFHLMNTLNAQVYFLNVHLNKKLTGVERSSLLRAKIFHERLGVTPVIVTIRYHHLLRQIYQNHIKEGTVRSSLSLLNMYEEFQGSRMGTKQIGFQENPSFDYKEVKDTKDYRVYSEGKLIQYIKRLENGTISYINYFANGKKVGRYKYDVNGYLSVYQMLDPETSRVLQEDFYHIDGTVRIRKHFRTVQGKHQLQSILLFDLAGSLHRVFLAEDDLIGYWLEQLFEDQQEYYCFVDKNRFYYEHLIKFSKSNVRIIPCIHAMHTQNHIEVMKSRVNHNYRPILEDVKRPDAIVVLTEQQKQDISNRFGEEGNYHVIPHAIDQLPKPIKWKNRTPYKVVALSRYSSEKRLDHMIEIFAEVVKRVPEANLEIYGYGSEKAKLLKKIKELHMTNHIFLKNYVSDISDVYDSAALSLLTSRTEAFSLVTMESLAHGCPVISYDIKYGPSDMIVEGENGFLIPLDEQEQFADKIVELLKAPRKLKKMSAAAYRLRDDFSGQQVSRKWSGLLNELER